MSQLQRRPRNLPALSANQSSEFENLAKANQHISDKINSAKESLARAGYGKAITLSGNPSLELTKSRVVSGFFWNKKVKENISVLVKKDDVETKILMQKDGENYSIKEIEIAVRGDGSIVLLALKYNLECGEQTIAKLASCCLQTARTRVGSSSSLTGGNDQWRVTAL